MLYKKYGIAFAVLFVLLLFVPALLSDEAKAQLIPEWVKNTARWYGEDAITEVEFLNAIKFLIENDILVLEQKSEPEKVIDPESIRSEVVIPNGNSMESNIGFYRPLNLQVPVGTTVVWINDDVVGHTIQSQDDDGNPTGLFNSNILQTGDRFAHKFEETGVYSYYCTLHPWRVGTITVE